MNGRLLLVSVAFASALQVDPAHAHNPGHSGSAYGGLSGSVTVYSGGPYGPGYSGTINYGYGYPVAPPYSGAYFYPSCNHWHPKHYRAPANHAYNRGYAHGYSDGYTGGHYGHKKPKYKSKHGYRNGKGHHH